MLTDTRLRANRLISALAGAKPGVELDPTDELIFLRVSALGNLIVEIASAAGVIDVSAEDFTLAPGESKVVTMDCKTDARIAFQILSDPAYSISSMQIDYKEAVDAASIVDDDLCYVSTFTDSDATPVRQMFYNTRDLLMDPSTSRFQPAMPIARIVVTNIGAVVPWIGRILTITEGSVTYI